MAIIEVIAESAAARGLSGAGLARASGLVAVTVQKMLRGKLSPTTDQLQALCVGLETSMVAVMVRATAKLEP